ncbi:hypothetical protein QOT17_008593 [Balamuthia mandrillaris]
MVAGVSGFVWACWGVDRVLDEFVGRSKQERGNKNTSQRPVPTLAERAHASSFRACTLPEPTLSEAERSLLDWKAGCDGCHASAPFYAATEKLERQLVLVAGAEGSGTTFVAQLLSSISDKASFLPQQMQPRDTSSLAAFSKASHKLWSTGPWKQVEAAKEELLTHLLSLFLEGMGHRRSRSHLIMHRSYPDFDQNHYPDLSYDFFMLLRPANISFKPIIVFREPEEAAHSNYRRNWGHLRVKVAVPLDNKDDAGESGGDAKTTTTKMVRDLLSSARSTERWLTFITAQLRTLHPSDYILLNFNQLIAQHHQNKEEKKEEDKKEEEETEWCGHKADQGCELKRVTRFLGWSKQEEDRLKEMLQERSRPPSDFRHSLEEEEAAFLRSYFTPQRKAKWGWLRARSFCCPHLTSSSSSAAGSSTKEQMEGEGEGEGEAGTVEAEEMHREN